MANRFGFVQFIIKSKGIIYFFNRYLLESFFWIFNHGPYYIALRGIELFLPTGNDRKYTLPDYLQLEPTSRCNMNCRNCTRDTLSNFGDLSLDCFLYIIKQFPFLKRLKLQGLGEPLLNDALFDMAKFLKAKRINTYIATNGSLITKQSATELVRYFDKIEISIDSSDRSLLKDIRGQDCWESVLRGARLLSAVNKYSDIAINFVIEKRNANELKAMVGLANDLNIDHINIINLQNWVGMESPHQDKRSKISQRRIEIDEGINNRLKEAMEVAKSSNIYLDYLSLNNQKGACFWYKRGMYISWNGYVTPCCLRPNYEDFNFGNIFKKDIRDIWNSDAYFEFRKELAAGGMPQLCRGCNYV
jgi:radical SAM protein with 4Fe4S-binding SPASM domain